jgi:hypothetical protein
LQGRTCALQRNVGHVVAVIVEDWHNMFDDQPSFTMLARLAELERDMLTNVRASPFCRLKLVCQ